MRRTLATLLIVVLHRCTPAAAEPQIATAPEGAVVLAARGAAGLGFYSALHHHRNALRATVPILRTPTVTVNGNPPAKVEPPTGILPLAVGTEIACPASGKGGASCPAGRVYMLTDRVWLLPDEHYQRALAIAEARDKCEVRWGACEADVAKLTRTPSALWSTFKAAGITAAVVGAFFGGVYLGSQL